jgi:hypothetical protein
MLYFKKPVTGLFALGSPATCFFDWECNLTLSKFSWSHFLLRLTRHYEEVYCFFLFDGAGVYQ